jgi:hypothetical protein
LLYGGCLYFTMAYKLPTMYTYALSMLDNIFLLLIKM